MNTVQGEKGEGCIVAGIIWREPACILGQEFPMKDLKL
jgi:hypothetical protein